MQHLVGRGEERQQVWSRTESASPAATAKRSNASEGRERQPGCGAQQHSGAACRGVGGTGRAKGQQRELRQPRWPAPGAPAALAYDLKMRATRLNRLASATGPRLRPAGWGATRSARAWRPAAAGRSRRRRRRGQPCGGPRSHPTTAWRSPHWVFPAPWMALGLPRGCRLGVGSFGAPAGSLGGLAHLPRRPGSWGTRMPTAWSRWQPRSRGLTLPLRPQLLVHA